MPISQELLALLACPETKEPVALADDALITTINTAIQAGALHNRGGKIISDVIDSGLVRQDRKYLYPIRDDIPIMLIDEGIPLEHLVE
ncbi:hypothetical protein CSA56_08275 [candidate division KSB3 bacterium]|uniref:Trm112 family protein n=1 Tax=candidate division KSB3 bacterium TaxID=2044937 RepID=A0A2G6KH40_9BACT|nr:MAG: hypothetical protein CSA56_08275 [candidate division KSB3 bacterium]